jgi:hypothetical protein
VAVYVGQAEVAPLEAIRQPQVVNPQQVQQGRLQVVDGDDVLGGVVAQFAG